MPFSGATVNVQQPPKGVRIVDNPFKGKTITYRKFSPSMLMLFPMAVGFLGVTIFLLFGFNIHEYKFDSDRAIRTLLSIPFLAGTVVLFTAAFFHLLGCWRITITRDHLEVAMKLGPLSWTRRLACDRSAQVSMFVPVWGERLTRDQNYSHRRPLVQVECQGKTLNFGGNLPEDVKLFIAESIRGTLSGS